MSSRGDSSRRDRYDPESRFRDRDGREHYDNGRYAPQNNYGYDVDSMYHDDMENRFRDSRGRPHYDNGRFAPRNVWSDPPYMDDRYTGPRMDERRLDETGRRMPMIGFGDRDTGVRMHSDASVPRYNEMERRSGNVVSMHRPESYGVGEFTPELAEEWTSHMKNEDGTTGAHWSLEQVEKVIAQRGLDCDPYKFWAVMNAIYSDDVKVAKKHGVNTMDYYVDRAMAWINDKDAVKDKAAAYFEYIVKH